MAKKGLDTDRYGPLAKLDRMCDRMELALDPWRTLYPEVADRLRLLDYAIRWEMDRLKWEVRFAEAVKADQGDMAERRRRRETGEGYPLPPV